MKKLFLLFACIGFLSGYAQPMRKVIPVSDDIELIKLSDNMYIHVTYRLFGNNRTSGNGLIYIDKKKAFIFDSPWNEVQTEKLVTWIEDALKVKVVGFIPIHWHEDSMGGLGYFKSRKIKSYANQMTIDIAKEKGLPLADIGFTDSLLVHMGKKEIRCYYPGAAHSLDNIVIWLPSEQVLFAGCVLKSLEFKNLGFTGDGDVNAYPNTLNKVLAMFPNARIVVPGHGKCGGVEIIHHNIKLAEK